MKNAAFTRKFSDKDINALTKFFAGDFWQDAKSIYILHEKTKKICVIFKIDGSVEEKRGFELSDKDLVRFLNIARINYARRNKPVELDLTDCAELPEGVRCNWRIKISPNAFGNNVSLSRTSAATIVSDQHNVEVYRPAGFGHPEVLREILA